ncbi:MAG: hypothetical protein QF552_10995 [Litorilituus sp.]|nr:hypothetical protein [Litorilituus sp.]
MSDSGFSSQKLNLTLALCAILISIASFYATYLQASAAEKQVKAMTLPLMQSYTGNLDGDTKEETIFFTLENAGVGPALIKSISYGYQGVEYASRERFLKACCDKEREEHYKKINTTKKLRYSSITTNVLNTIIPAQTKVKHFQLLRGNAINKYWEKLNDERFLVSVKICYCSLLDECYVTEKNGFVEPVAACPINE